MQLLDLAVGHRACSPFGGAGACVRGVVDPYPSCVFFFSSRRRHTRYWRDWSSDVGSSDLGLEAGREYLRRIEPRSTDDSIQMIQVEAQLLRDAKEWKETYELLSKAVAKYPDSFEILYDRAMAAERIDKLDVLEKDLRLVIKMKPDYAHAYNALGYTLAEKTNRLTEAKGLIDQPIKLSPEDTFILDSLGLVHLAMGEMGEALKQLQTAYSTRPDPEIAAHLGEVLWSAGQRDEAQKIWRAALSENPNHETLLAVMQKHRP